MQQPSKRQKEIVEKAAFLRGSIITSFAQVEFIMADLAVKCERFPEYGAVVPKFPYKLEDRIRAVQALISMPGPFEKYRPTIEPQLRRILDFEELRHFLAHGLLIVRTSGQQHSLEYRMYRPEKAGLKIGFMVIDLEQLTNASHDLASYAQSTMQAFKILYLDLGIE